MSNLSRRQQTAIASFLQVSRVHFGLCRRRTGLWSRLRRFRKTMIQTMLIVGSIGSQLGGAAYAEISAIEKSETRTERTAPSSSTTTTDRGVRSVVERMP